MEEARRIFQRTGEIAWKVSPWLWQEISLLILDSLLDGDPTFSSEIVSQVRQLQEHSVSLTPVLEARLLLRESKPGEALIVLEEALAELNNTPAYNTIRYVALSALAHRAMGDENRALALLQQALEFGEAENRVASFVREGEAMEKLLQLAQAKAMTPQFVQRLLEAFEARRTFKPQSNIVSEALIEPLSEREMDILKLLAQGCSDKVIAKTLVIAPDTVHKHLGNIYNKLDVHRRTEAIARARELDLL
jgi:LuxR family maltose regulon positive regulatory protein